MSDTECRPLHVLAALAELDGAIGSALQSDGDRALYDGPFEQSGGGATSNYLCGQVQGGSQQYASERGEPMLPEHLLVVLIDQADSEVIARLAGVGLDPVRVRRAALAVFGEPLDRPVLDLPPLTPAGTMDRPPLEVEELDPRAWAVLVWRQQRLPLHRIRRVSHWYALSSAERRAAWKVADESGVDDDQRYSLLARHSAEVNARAHAVHPSIVDAPVDISTRRGYKSRAMIAQTLYGRRLRRRLVPNFMIGWPTWFRNRRVGMRDRWFRVRTLNTFRGQPKIRS
jgi:hypothetical protein